MEQIRKGHCNDIGFPREGALSGGWEFSVWMLFNRQLYVSDLVHIPNDVWIYMMKSREICMSGWLLLAL